MAQDRKIQFSTQVVPKIEFQRAARAGVLEEYDRTQAAYQHNKLHTSVNKKLGGNGYIDVNSTQWGDAWTSMTGINQEWEDFDEVWNTTASTWDTGEGDVAISTTQVQLSSDGSDLQFCYIKNLGSTAVIISLDGDSTYPLKLSGGASTMFRGYSSNLKVNEVYVKTASGTSTIEYLIAK